MKSIFLPSEDLFEVQRPLYANSVLVFVVFTTSQHDIQLCDHVNTREEHQLQLVKMEKKTKNCLICLCKVYLKTESCRAAYFT